MNWLKPFGIFIAITCSLSAAACSVEAATRSLFNGKNLEGWHVDVPDADENPDLEKSFIVREGLLVSKGDPRGHLITDEVFENYRLETEYRFAGKPGNCGVLVHASKPRALYGMFPQSLEVQMAHENAGDFWCIAEDIVVPNMEERRGPKSAWGTTKGKKRRILNLTDGSEKPLGEWNTMVIECVGNAVKVWVNGDLVNHGTGCTASKGQIAIQAEGAEVEFRKLMLSPVSKLPPDEAMMSAQTKQVLERRTYTLVDAEAEETLDAYLEQALVPALTRQGLGPIGVFDQADDTNEGPIEVMLLIAGPSAEAVTGATDRLATDQEYQAAAKSYLQISFKEPLLKRIRSELLMSFDCWPQVTIPQQKQDGKDRLFELRIYESSTEQAGHVKVDMFNSGEVPIFLDSGIMPVFMGQALIGDKTPNLTYMTVYDGADSRGAAWKKFVDHPDWHQLKAIEKYKDTVSRIHKTDWKPKSYSQL